jgi:hypothetical protein
MWTTREISTDAGNKKWPEYAVRQGCVPEKRGQVPSTVAQNAEKQEKYIVECAVSRILALGRKSRDIPVKVLIRSVKKSRKRIPRTTEGLDFNERRSQGFL